MVNDQQRKAIFASKEHGAGDQPHPAIAALHNFMGELGKLTQHHLAAGKPQKMLGEEAPAHEAAESPEQEIGEAEPQPDHDPVADLFKRMAPKAPASQHMILGEGKPSHKPAPFKRKP